VVVEKLPRCLSSLTEINDTIFFFLRHLKTAGQKKVAGLERFTFAFWDKQALSQTKKLGKLPATIVCCCRSALAKFGKHKSRNRILKYSRGDETGIRLGRPNPQAPTA
jgi:hypothetical protein